MPSFNLLGQTVWLPFGDIQEDRIRAPLANIYVDFSLLVILRHHSFLVYSKKPKIDDVTVNTE